MNVKNIQQNCLEMLTLIHKGGIVNINQQGGVR